MIFVVLMIIVSVYVVDTVRTVQGYYTPTDDHKELAPLDKSYLE